MTGTTTTITIMSTGIPNQNRRAELCIRGPLTVNSVVAIEKKHRGNGGFLPRTGL
jgi:hypothetical protein